MYTFAKESFDTVYCGKLLRIPHLIQIFIYIGIIILPFVIVFATPNFWIIVAREEHQIDIRYKGNYILLITNNNTQQYQSNILDIDTQNFVMSISSFQDDFNSDSLLDTLEVNMSVYVKSELITQVIVILPVYCSVPALNFNFTSLIYLQYQDTGLVGGLNVIGRLTLKQEEPIPYTSNSNDIPVQTMNYEYYSNEVPYEKMIRQNYLSPYRLEQDHIISRTRANLDRLDINIYYQFDQGQSLHKWVNILATVKLAWLQYMSIFILAFIFGREILTFLFRFRIVESTQKSNIELNSY
ncbi:hypothetical protein pb186bvf_004157 [Paramecium bursaria]